MVAREDGEIFDLVAARTAAVCAVVADEGAIAEEEEVRVRVEKGAARIASEAVQMPSIASCSRVLLALLIPEPAKRSGENAAPSKSMVCFQ